jgi:hypothetical protein
MNWMIDTLEDYFLVSVFIPATAALSVSRNLLFITAQNYGYDLPDVLFHI